MNTSPHPLSLLASPELQQSMGQGGGRGLGKEVRFGGGPFPLFLEEERGGKSERSHLFDCNRSRGPFLPSFSFFGPIMQSGRKKTKAFLSSFLEYIFPSFACMRIVCCRSSSVSSSSSDHPNGGASARLHLRGRGERPRPDKLFDFGPLLERGGAHRPFPVRICGRKGFLEGRRNWVEP